MTLHAHTNKIKHNIEGSGPLQQHQRRQQEIFSSEIPQKIINREITRPDWNAHIVGIMCANKTMAMTQRVALEA